LEACQQQGQRTRLDHLMRGLVASR
jgi:hypothetical protein